SASGQPSPADFGLPVPKVTFGPDTTDGFGDNANQNLESLTIKRNKILTEANECLKLIEIVMGDFSGLGLCDIIAIISSLNIMSLENLLGFLDEDAQNRMFTSLNLKKDAVVIGSYDDAMAELFATVRGFYNLMDQIYKDFSDKGIS